MSKKIILLITVQILSLFGTHMSNFGLSIYLYEQTHSIALYSYFSMMIVLPEIILAPIIGHYVDRFNKKWLMLLGHGGAGVASIAILWLLQSGYSGVYGYLGLVLLGSLFNGLVFASFHVVIGYEVKESKMQHASSMIELGFGLIMIVSPAIGAYLLETQGVEKIFYIDISTFLVALVVISLLRLKKSSLINQTHDNPFWSSLKENIAYLKSHKMLRLTLFIVILVQFNMAQTTVLITPVILSIASKSTLGMVITLSGVGMLIASVVMMKLKIIRSLYWINRFAMLQVLILFLAIFHVNIIHIAIGSFLFMALSSMLNITNYSYWQKEIENSKKGQLFALRSSIMMFSLLLGYLLSAPLVAMTKEILMHSTILSNAIGSYLMPQIRLLFIINGVVILLLVLWIEYYRRRVER